MNPWNNAEHHAEKAYRFYESGQWTKALDELKQALAVNPQQSEWHFGMGLTLEALHRYDEAIDSYRQVLTLRGDDAEVLTHMAAAQIRSDRAHDAITTLEALEQLEPDNESSYCYRIAAYAQIGEHEQAELMFYLAQQVNDRCPQCYDHLARSLVVRDQLDRAVWCWQHTLHLDPHYPDAHANLARAYWQKGQLERANHYYILQLREDPGDTDTLLQLGHLLTEMGRRTQAREKFSRVLEMDPTATDAYLHLGELSLLAGRLDAAVTELEMAARLAPDRPGVHLGLAKVAWRRKQTTLAKKYLLSETQRQGHTPGQSLELARMLIEMRLLKEAIHALAPLIKKPTDDDHPDPTDQQRAYALLYQGVALILGDNFQAGVRYCRGAIHLGNWGYAKLTTPSQAEKPAASTTPGALRHKHPYIAALQYMIEAHLQLAQWGRAAYWLDRARRIEPQNRDFKRLRHRLTWLRYTTLLRYKSKRTRP